MTHELEQQGPRGGESYWREQWRLRPDTIYLNHGSFGPPPQPVVEVRRRWQAALDEQPMDFFVRQYEPAWLESRRRLGQFIGTRDENLVFVENATHAMNVVADSFPLGPDDEVLLNDHEYGAVIRIWQRRCAEVGAAPPKIAALPLPIESADQIVDSLFAHVTPRTRMIVVSHITSPTAVIFPVEQICRRAARDGIAVCVDGPHAPAQIPVSLDELGADFYAASCHKWLSAPFGSGFLYAAPRWHAHVRSPLLSWGRLLPALPEKWDDEFLWSGTRDSSAYFAIPAAIDFLESYGWERFRKATHDLAQYARHALVDAFRLTPIIPDDPAWYGTMAHVPLPPGDARSLQVALWQQYQIEVPIVAWNGARYVRVSCHLYNDPSQIDRLVAALKKLS